LVALFGFGGLDSMMTAVLEGGPLDARRVNADVLESPDVVESRLAKTEPLAPYCYTDVKVL
jgi:hypothetical protein